MGRFFCDFEIQQAAPDFVRPETCLPNKNVTLAQKGRWVLICQKPVGLKR